MAENTTPVSGVSPSREAVQALLDALPAGMTDTQKGPIAAIGFRLFEMGMEYQREEAARGK